MITTFSHTFANAPRIANAQDFHDRGIGFEISVIRKRREYKFESRALEIFLCRGSSSLAKDRIRALLNFPYICHASDVLTARKS